MVPLMTPRDVGWIEVITGCMFSGKTEELIRRVRRARYANLAPVQERLPFGPNLAEAG